MQIKSITKTTDLSAVTIWNKYVDVKNWKSWDPDVESSELFGDFVEGTQGILKPIGGPQAKFVITTVTKYIYFADRSFLPFAYIDFEHTIFDNGEVRQVTHTISIGGFLAPVFNFILGKTLANGLEEAVENLCKN
jgi:hypothetical protein